MGLWLDNYYMMEKPSPYDDIPSTFEMLERMSKLWRGIDAEEAIRMVDLLTDVGNISAYSAEEVGAALSKFSERVVDDDKFKKPEIEYRVL